MFYSHGLEMRYAFPWVLYCHKTASSAGTEGIKHVQNGKKKKKEKKKQLHMRFGFHFMKY